jgi:uncharacterized delta-60 repeat protein
VKTTMQRIHWHTQRAAGAARLEALETRTHFDAGSVDATFGTGGKAHLDVAGLAENASVVRVLPDGKILVAGDATFAFTTNVPPELAGSVQTRSRGFVARLNPDGSLDASFGDNGIAPQPSDPYAWIAHDQLPDFPEVTSVGALAVGPDGAIYLGGTANAWYPYTGPEPTGPGAQPVSFAFDQAFAVAAYNADGSLRTSFGHNGVALADLLSRDAGGDDESVRGLAVQADGKVLAVGLVQKQQTGGADADQADDGVVRFGPDGSVDETFGRHVEDFPRFAPDRPRMEHANVVAVQPDGKVVVAGTTSAAEGRGSGWALVRYNSDGTHDATFGDAGRVIAPGFAAPDPSDPQNNTESSEPQQLAVQSDGRILALGGLSTSYIAMMRFTPDGGLDATFGTGGRVTARAIHAGGYSLSPHADGSFSVAGVGSGSDWVTQGDNTFTVVATGHEVYTASFDPAGRRVSSARATHIADGATETLSRAAVAPDGKIVAVGFAFPAVNNGNPVYAQTADALVMRFDPTLLAPDAPDAGGAVTPAFSGRSVVRAGKASTFRLTFDTEAAAREASVVVTGPDGAATAARLVRVKLLRGGGRSRAVGATRRAVATYRVAAPGGKYDAADNGTYSIRVAVGGDPAAGATAGQFTVASGARAGARRRATDALRDQ